MSRLDHLIVEESRRKSSHSCHYHRANTIPAYIEHHKIDNNASIQPRKSLSVEEITLTVTDYESTCQQDQQDHPQEPQECREDCQDVENGISECTL